MTEFLLPDRFLGGNMFGIKPEIAEWLCENNYHYVMLFDKYKKKTYINLNMSEEEFLLFLLRFP